MSLGKVIFELDLFIDGSLLLGVIDLEDVCTAIDENCFRVCSGTTGVDLPHPMMVEVNYGNFVTRWTCNSLVY